MPARRVQVDHLPAFAVGGLADRDGADSVADGMTAHFQQDHAQSVREIVM